MKINSSSRSGVRNMTRKSAVQILALSMVAFTGIAVFSDTADAKPAPKPRLRKHLERAPETYIELTPAGQQLQAKYEAMHAALKAEIEKELPKVDPAKQKAFLDALATQKQAYIAVQRDERNFRRGYQNNVGGLQFLEQRLAETPKRIADAEALMKNAEAMPADHPDKALAMDEAVKIQKETAKLDQLPAQIAKAKANLAASESKKAQLQSAVDASVKALAEARAKTQQALKDLSLDPLLSSAKLDAKLAQFTVLQEATLYWLAAYAQQGAKQEKNIDDLLGSPSFIIQMLVSDGPVWEKFGSAVEIYQAIQAASPKAKEGLFQQLAMAVALEHAVPVILEKPEALGPDVQYVDPVKRYLSYEKAYLAGELDSTFKDQNTWNLRMVVHGQEPDETSAWGRQMLRNYRPDLVTLEDFDWRYVRSVDTEVNYTSAYQKLGWDKPELQRFQNILAVGGICGRRAFFGGFILRAYGVPTMERPEQGHAALVHWTPRGWVPCLGGPWGSGNREQFYRYLSDLDFLASTQARENEKAFMKVKRAQWIGGVYGEAAKYGYHDRVKAGAYDSYVTQSLDKVPVPTFWQAVSAVAQDGIIAELNAKVRAAVGEDLGESNEAMLKAKIDQVEIPASERKITVDAKGVIHIPAAACSSPTNNTEVIRFMPSNLGGMQLHYSRKAVSDAFAYTFDAPKAGKYQLTARLVTPAPKQYLFLNVNEAAERVVIDLPYTIGNWGDLEPVEIELAQGKNTLTFSRGHFYIRGVSIRDFTLTPVK